MSCQPAKLLALRNFMPCQSDFDMTIPAALQIGERGIVPGFS